MNLNATLIGQTIAFIVFVWFCMKFVWPPIINVIETRQKAIADSLLAAEQARKEVASSKDAVEEEINQAKQKAQQIIDSANKRKNEILESVKDESEKLKASIIKQAHNEISLEKKKVEEELKKKVASLVITGAEKIIMRNVDQAANNDLIDKVVDAL